MISRLATTAISPLGTIARISVSPSLARTTAANVVPLRVVSVTRWPWTAAKTALETGDSVGGEDCGFAGAVGEASPSGSIAFAGDSCAEAERGAKHAARATTNAIERGEEE